MWETLYSGVEREGRVEEWEEIMLTSVEQCPGVLLAIPQCIDSPQEIFRGPMLWPSSTVSILLMKDSEFNP